MVTVTNDSPVSTAGAMERSEIEAALERLHPDSYGWALACCCRDPVEAEDILQMSYLKVLQGSARFFGRSSFRTWLFGVIRRSASERRRQLAVRRRLLRWWSARRVEPQKETVPQAIERSTQSKRLIAALSLLSRRQREILELVFYHEMTIEEASLTLGLSLGSARTHYHRGKKNLRSRLEELKR